MVCVDGLQWVVERTFPPSTLPQTAVRRAVAELEGCRPGQLGTLEEAVDTDELEALVDPSSGGRTEGADAVQFRYCGYPVEVRSDRGLHIEE